MGTRVNYEIMREDIPQAAVILYSNSHHDQVDPEALFLACVSRCLGPDSLTRILLAETYPTPHGNHRAGDPVFTVDVAPGDRERVHRVSFIQSALRQGSQTPNVHIATLNDKGELQKIRAVRVNT